jgi:8-oxo-dGTP pyrophosphatase MutT (NUDIX family)
MLVTSRRTKRWIIPKGWPMRRKEAHATAKREAFEEAGVIGPIGTTPVGSYLYEKRLKEGQVVTCEVLVFPLEVKRQQKDWPEKGSRQIRWLPLANAAAAVQDGGLGEIIRRLAQTRCQRTPTALTDS